MNIFEMNQLSDAALNRDMNKYLANCDRSQAAIEARIEELKDEYIDDVDQIWDVLITEDYVDYEAVQEVIRAIVCAHKYKRDDSLLVFAKSFAQMILEGIDKKAEVKANEA